MTQVLFQFDHAGEFLLELPSWVDNGVVYDHRTCVSFYCEHCGALFGKRVPLNVTILQHRYNAGSCLDCRRKVRYPISNFFCHRYEHRIRDVRYLVAEFLYTLPGDLL